MTGVELIVAALAAGAAAGTSELATGAVRDAYAGLRNKLRGRLSGRTDAAQLLDAEPTGDREIWQVRLGREIAATGADRDEDVVTAAQHLLSLTDSAGSAAGRYAVTADGAHSVQVGDHTVHVGTNNGAVGSFHGHVNFQPAAPVPPDQPAR
jgi:hypothetical protein